MINFKDLNKTIENWLNSEIEQAVDKDFYILNTLMIADMYLESSKESQSIYSFCNYSYKLYLLGEFEEAGRWLNIIVDDYIKEIKAGKVAERFLSLLEIDSRNIKKESILKEKIFEMIKAFLFYAEAYRIMKKKYPQHVKEFEERETEDQQKLKIYNPVNKTPEEVIKKFCTSFCPKMKIQIPEEHFAILKTKKSKLNNRPFLDEEKFKHFIKRAFLGEKNTGKLKFNMAPHGEKLMIQKVFYDFYENNKHEFQLESTDCVNILKDNFSGYENINQKNFRAKTKRRNLS